VRRLPKLVALNADGEAELVAPHVYPVAAYVEDLIRKGCRWRIVRAFARIEYPGEAITYIEALVEIYERRRREGKL
jgi:hypothetical protein